MGEYVGGGEVYLTVLVADSCENDVPNFIGSDRSPLLEDEEAASSTKGNDNELEVDELLSKLFRCI